ncbi:hypothetical protein H0H92_005553 [Tricholoma furcatifolium]|nr:hypothetical protein H0H92_005553 [Tricholoma furcatifolium]
MSSNFKRHRASSSQDSSSSTSTVEVQHPSKTSRTVPEQASSTLNNRPLLCTLPPTCNHKPTHLANSRELETHYATYHAHHQTECHDPLAAVRKDRGEKIAHGYPKEYFFAVTNKGVGGLLKKWGEGASLIRGEWKSREDDNDDDSDENGEDVADYRDNDTYPQEGPTHAHAEEKSNADDALDALADTMGSLSLVPSSIRFGRGGNRRGFLHNYERGGSHGTGNLTNSDYRGRGRGARGRGRGRGYHASTTMDVDPPSPAGQPHLGHAGRGRIRIAHQPRGRGEARSVPKA